MSETRKVAALLGNGHVGLVEQAVPPLRAGAVRVAVRASLVSPGTELGGWQELRRRRDESARSAAGDQSAGGAEPKPFGYANAGVVEAVGEGVEELDVGDRVACMGAGYALHTDVAVVPHHLCVRLPEGVGFAAGAYAHLGATALNALRRGGPGLGEYVAVVGLGLVGQLAAQLHRLAGCSVIGWDTIRFRTEVAEQWGIDATCVVGADSEVTRTRDFAAGRGLDSAVLAFGGPADAAVAAIEQCLMRSPDGHPYGRIVVVGGARFAYTSTLTNVDVRRASRTGPGYHDEPWEFGPDYPPVFVRWSTRSNLQLIVRLISTGRLDVDCLTTHTVALADADAGVQAALDDPERILGLVFTMDR